MSFKHNHYFADPPIVTISPSKSLSTVYVGDQLFLLCIAEGYPIPTIKWYSSNSVFPQQYGPLYPILTYSPHPIQYTCEGINMVGKANASVIISRKSSNVNGDAIILSVAVHIVYCKAKISSSVNAFRMYL